MTIFRLARPAPVAWNLTKTLLQSACMWTVFLWLLPQAILWVEGRLGLATFSIPGQTCLGAGVLVLASCGGVWSGYTMATHGAGTPLPCDAATRLVVVGPYAYVRNPMAVFGLAQGLGVGTWLGSPLVLAYVAAGIASWNWIARPAEERFMLQHFGAEYERYRRAVRCWVPRARGFRPR